MGIPDFFRITNLRDPRPTTFNKTEPMNYNFDNYRNEICSTYGKIRHQIHFVCSKLVDHAISRNIIF